MPRSRRWSDAQLRIAVPRSRNLKEVLGELGLAPGGGSHVAVRGRIEELGLDVSHFEVCARDRQAERLAKRSASRSVRRGWTDNELRVAVESSRSIAGVIRALDLKIGGSVYVTIKRRIATLGLDTSHFTGQAWNKGMRDPTAGHRRPLSEILVAKSNYLNTAALRRRLLKEGVLPACCERCKRTEWNGEPIPLQLDHVNGDRTDNRLENLRLLCPNCHAQTDTWCGKNHGRYDRTE